MYINCSLLKMIKFNLLYCLMFSSFSTVVVNSMKINWDMDWKFQMGDQCVTETTFPIVYTIII